MGLILQILIVEERTHKLILTHKEKVKHSLICGKVNNTFSSMDVFNLESIYTSQLELLSQLILLMVLNLELLLL